MGDQIESSLLLTLSFFLPQLSFVFNPLNAKGVYIRPLMVISVTKYVFHGQPRAFIYVRWLFVLWILGRCICYIGTYIYALGCWCQNSVAFKQVIADWVTIVVKKRSILNICGNLGCTSAKGCCISCRL